MVEKMTAENGLLNGVESPALGKQWELLLPPPSKHTKMFLNRFELQDVAYGIFKDDRRDWKGCMGCLRWFRRDTAFVEGVLSKSKKKLKHKGLQTCGNVHLCPNCSYFIAKHRRSLIRKIIDMRLHRLVLVTLTIQHNRLSKLKDLLDDLYAALQKIRNGSKHKKFYDRLKVDGYIRTLEILLGNYGWHPHFHELIFIPKDVDFDVASIKKYYIEKYGGELARRGYLVNSKTVDVRIGVSERDVERMSGYLAKNEVEAKGLDWEVTSGAIKKGQGVTMLQALQLYHQTGNEFYAGAWLEYAVATKDKHKMTWARGFKKRMLGDEADKTKSEILSEAVDKSYETLLYRLFSDHWQRALDMGLRNGSDMYKIAEKCNFDSHLIVDKFIEMGIVDERDRLWVLPAEEAIKESGSNIPMIVAQGVGDTFAAKIIKSFGKGLKAKRNEGDVLAAVADSLPSVSPAAAVPDVGSVDIWNLESGISLGGDNNGGNIKNLKPKSCFEGDIGGKDIYNRQSTIGLKGGLNMDDRRRKWADTAVDMELAILRGMASHRIEKGGSDAVRSMCRIASVIKGDGKHISFEEAETAVVQALKHFEGKNIEKRIRYQWKRAYNRSNPRYMGV